MTPSVPSLRVLCGAALALSPWVAAFPQPTEPLDCVSATQSVTLHRSSKPDIETLRHCVITGGEALATLWRNDAALSDPALRGATVNASVELRDGRIYRAVLAAVESHGLHTDVRLAALAVLTSYVDSDAVVSEGWLRQPRPSGHLVANSGLTRSSNRIRFKGITSVTALPPDRIAQLLLRLRHDPDAAMRNAALVLRQAFALREPRLAPLDPGAIALVAGCGTVLTVRSKADIAMPIRLRTLGTRVEHARYIDAGYADPPNHGYAMPAGIVVALYGDEEVARLSARDGPCAPGQIRNP